MRTHDEALAAREEARARIDALREQVRVELSGTPSAALAEWLHNRYCRKNHGSTALARPRCTWYNEDDWGGDEHINWVVKTDAVCLGAGMTVEKLAAMLKEMSG